MYFPSGSTSLSQFAFHHITILFHFLISFYMERERTYGISGRAVCVFLALSITSTRSALIRKLSSYDFPSKSHAGPPG